MTLALRVGVGILAPWRCEWGRLCSPFLELRTFASLAAVHRLDDDDGDDWVVDLGLACETVERLCVLPGRLEGDADGLDSENDGVGRPAFPERWLCFRFASRDGGVHASVRCERGQLDSPSLAMTSRATCSTSRARSVPKSDLESMAVPLMLKMWSYTERSPQRSAIEPA